MAHILLGWEFGGNRGHATKLLHLGRGLRARGHEVTLALQRLDSITPDQAGDMAVWQAPLSPRLLANQPRRDTQVASTLGDILARLGLDDADLGTAILLAWRRLLSAVKPDLVCADYAPLLLLAARGRLPTVASGTGFDLPPAELPAFPSLTGKPAGRDEATTLAAVNRALVGLDVPPLAALPQVFAADASIVGTFAELDPYHEATRRPLAAPFLPHDVPEPGADGGEEIFVYGSVQIPADAALWDGLTASGLPIRVYVPEVPESYRESLRDRGYAVELLPLPFAEIARRSRLLVSHGGHGFVCSGLLAGLPQIICPVDLEKALIAAAVTRLNVGGAASLRSLQPDRFGGALRRVYDDALLRERARVFAAELRRRTQSPFEMSLFEAVDRGA